MTPDISIIFPHLRQPANDKALAIALDCIVDNTALDYELMIESVAERRDIYPVFNQMVKRANAEWVVLSNTDVFFAPQWAEPMYEARDMHTIINGVIVEPGAIGVASANKHAEYGFTPATFRRSEFESWVSEHGEVTYNLMDKGRSWYLPCLIHRDTWLEFGGFDTSTGTWPEWPVDLYTWDKWAAAGNGFRRVNSFSYHIQNWSSEREQSREMRYK